MVSLTVSPLLVWGMGQGFTGSGSGGFICICSEEMVVVLCGSRIGGHCGWWWVGERTADSVVPLVLCACSERANDWGMATSAPRLARANSSMGSRRHVLIAPLIWGEGGGGTISIAE